MSKYHRVGILFAVLLATASNLFTQTARDLKPFPQTLIQLPEDSVTWAGDEIVPILIGRVCAQISRSIADSLQAFIQDNTGLQARLEEMPIHNQFAPRFRIGLPEEIPLPDSLAAYRSLYTGGSQRSEGYSLLSDGRNVVLRGWDDRGLAYGWQTLKQLLQASDHRLTVEGVFIDDYPDFLVRLLHFGTNFQVAANIDRAIPLMQRAYNSRLNATMVGDVKFNRLDQVPDWYFDNVHRFQAEVARLNLNVLPAVADFGYSEGMLWDNPNLAEGLPVVGARLVVENGVGRLVPDAGMQLSNGDFEQVNNNRFAGWTWQENAGQSLFDDQDVVYSGQHSVRMENFRGANGAGNCRFQMLLDCQPHLNYYFSIMCRTRNYSADWGVQAVPYGWINDNLARALAYPDFGVGANEDWRKLEISFNSLDYTQIRLYFGVWGGDDGQVWFDDARLTEVAFVNLLRRPGCPLTITSADGQTTYDEGADYAPLVDTLSGNIQWPGDFNVYHQPPQLRVQGGRIQNGDTLLAGFYHPIITNGFQMMICPSEDETYQNLTADGVRIADLWQPQGFFLSHDEIRVMNWCDACQRRGLTPAEILADNVQRCTDIYHQILPNAPLYIWSDMFDPYHNAVANYYLVNGSLEGSGDHLPEGLRVVDWNQPNMDRSIEYFAGLGLDVVGSADCSYDMSAARVWGEGIRRSPHGIGMMFTTWSGRYDHLEEVGEYMWSLAPHIIYSAETIQPPFNRLTIPVQVFIGDDPASEGVSVERVDLFYATQGDTAYQLARFNSVGGELYMADLNLRGATGVRYYIEALDSHGNFKRLPREAPAKTLLLGDNWQSAPIAIPAPPQEFRLAGAYPNPFNSRTLLQIDLPTSGRLSLVVTDPAGREVERREITVTAGRVALPLDAADWVSGVYLARGEFDGKTAVIKLSCIK